MSLAFLHRFPAASLAAMAAASLGAVGLALVSQHVFDMQPCPWCVLQRLVFVLIALAAGTGALWRRPAGRAAAAAEPPAPPPRDVAFVVGASSHSSINPDYVTRTFSVSRYPLSAACTVSKLLNALEHALGVL